MAPVPLFEAHSANRIVGSNPTPSATSPQVDESFVETMI